MTMNQVNYSNGTKWNLVNNVAGIVQGPGMYLATVHFVNPYTSSDLMESHEPTGNVQSDTGTFFKTDERSDGWIIRLREDLYAIHGVERVYMERQNDTINIWTLIPNRDLGLVRRISMAQRRIMQDFVGQQANPKFLFDFHTIYRWT